MAPSYSACPVDSQKDQRRQLAPLPLPSTGPALSSPKILSRQTPGRGNCRATVRGVGDLAGLGGQGTAIRGARRGTRGCGAWGTWGSGGRSGAAREEPLAQPSRPSPRARVPGPRRMCRLPVCSAQAASRAHTLTAVFKGSHLSPALGAATASSRPGEGRGVGEGVKGPREKYSGRLARGTEGSGGFRPFPSGFFSDLSLLVRCVHSGGPGLPSPHLPSRNVSPSRLPWLWSH